MEEKTLEEIIEEKWQILDRLALELYEMQMKLKSKKEEMD